MSSPLPPAGSNNIELPQTDPLHGLAPAGLARIMRTNPAMALRLLQQPGRLPEPAVQTVLLAETQLRLGHNRHAATAAIRAVNLAADLHPPQPTVLLAAVTVLTDISVCTPDPGAVDACVDLLGFATDHQDPLRMLIAHVLHAVAVYHHTDCRRGQDLLADLHQDPVAAGSATFTAMLNGGTTAMTAWCATRPTGQPPSVGRLSPVPGGLLHADPVQPAKGWLDQRITALRCAGTHTACTPPRREARP